MFPADSRRCEEGTSKEIAFQGDGLSVKCEVLTLTLLQHQLGWDSLEVGIRRFFVFNTTLTVAADCQMCYDTHSCPLATLEILITLTCNNVLD